MIGNMNKYERNKYQKTTINMKNQTILFITISILIVLLTACASSGPSSSQPPEDAATVPSPSQAPEQDAPPAVAEQTGDTGAPAKTEPPSADTVRKQAEKSPQEKIDQVAHSQEDYSYVEADNGLDNDSADVHTKYALDAPNSVGKLEATAEIENDSIEDQDASNDIQKTAASEQDSASYEAVPSYNESEESISLISLIGGADTIDSCMVYRVINGESSPVRTTVTERNQVQAIIDILSQKPVSITEYGGQSGYTVAFRLYSGDKSVCRVQPADERLFVSYDKKHYIMEYPSNISASLLDVL